MKILAINPGSTSSKIAVFDNCGAVFSETVRYSAEQIAKFPKIIDQYEFRRDKLLDSLKENGIDIKTLDAVVGRGGLLKPIPGGVYRVNDALIADLKKEFLGEHASNLGGILAREIAIKAGKENEAYIVDPVVVDEMNDLARFSGIPELPRMSIFHALNQKAVARRYARENHKKYEELNLIVAHLGGGITVGAHKKGKVTDVNNGLDGDGPFSPERAGSVPIGALAKLCYSDKYQYQEIKKMITGKGGMVAYLGTNNGSEVEKLINDGDKEAKNCFEAMAYQVSKEIGSLASVLKGEVDAIIITGGMAHSKIFTGWIRERVGFIAKIEIYAGEDEMKALSESVYYAKLGEQPIIDYV